MYVQFIFVFFMKHYYYIMEVFTVINQKKKNEVSVMTPGQDNKNSIRAGL